jgi:hypothetical protein
MAWRPKLSASDEERVRLALLVPDNMIVDIAREMGVSTGMIYRLMMLRDWPRKVRWQSGGGLWYPGDGQRFVKKKPRKASVVKLGAAR